MSGWEEFRRQALVPLTTERLALHPVRPLSFARRTRHWTEDRDAMNDLGLRPKKWTLLRWWRTLRRFNRKGNLCFGIWPRMEGVTPAVPLGFVTVQVSRPSMEATVGILIGDKAWRGRNFGAEAKGAVIDHLFSACGMHRVASWANGRNIASIHTTLRLGLTQEACLREQVLLPDGSRVDQLGFALLRRDWLDRRAKGGEVKT